MEKFLENLKVKGGRGRRVVIITALVVLLAVAAIALLNNTGAWLYDSTSFEVDYSIIELDFDLNSNHMYYYYNDGSNINFENTALFKTTLLSLQAIQSEFDEDFLTGRNPNISNYDNDVKALLDDIYPAGMISELEDLHASAGNEATEDGKTAVYNAGATTIYNKYSDQVYYPFRIRNLAYGKVESGKSMWYYYVKDMLNMYLGEYMIVNRSDGFRTSTVQVGVKLPGGTTYSSDTGGAYYDKNFNRTVMPFTMRFDNTTQADVFMSMNIDLESKVDLTSSGGILAMLLPRNIDFGNVAVVSGEKDYRSFISGLLKEEHGESYTYTNSLGTSVTEDIDYLSYEGMRAALSVWNEDARQTYLEDKTLASPNGNIRVSMDDGEGGMVSNVGANLIMWADYEACEEAYREAAGDDWAQGEEYRMFRYDFRVNICTTFKDTSIMDKVASEKDIQNAYVTDETGLTTLGNTYDTYSGVSNFSVEGAVYFDQGGDVRVDGKKYIRGGSILCDYQDSTAENYIGKLRVDVEYKGYSPAYIRVELVEQWTNSKNQILGMEQINFTKAEPWVDNRANDLYFYSPEMYFSNATHTLTTDGTPKKINIPVITGMTGDITIPDPEAEPEFAGDLDLKVAVSVEAVQPNRVEAIWKLAGGVIPDTDAGRQE